MGKIDKEKLLKEIRSLGYYEETQVIRTIKNFPEEPEIDFDALYYEWSEKPMDWSESRSPYDQARSFRDFLKSKNLTVPKPVEIPVKCPSCGCLSFKIDESMMCSACGTVFELTRKLEIPVKKTWTLKKEYYDFAIDMIQPISLMQTTDKEPKHKQYYDLHEEPDYSQVPVGAYIVVKFKEFNRSKCGVVCQHYRDFFNIDTGDNHHSVPYNGDGVESIEILKMPENVK